MSDTDDMTTPQPPDTRIGFRDIYRAVGESEARITSRINETFIALSKDAEDHEARIRTIEAAVMPLAIMTETRDRRLAQVESVASEAMGALDHYRARDSGVFATLSAGKQIVLLTVSIIGGVSGILSIIVKIAA